MPSFKEFSRAYWVYLSFLDRVLRIAPRVIAGLSAPKPCKSDIVSFFFLSSASLASLSDCSCSVCLLDSSSTLNSAVRSSTFWLILANTLSKISFFCFSVILGISLISLASTVLASLCKLLILLIASSMFLAPYFASYAGEPIGLSDNWTVLKCLEILRYAVSTCLSTTASSELSLDSCWFFDVSLSVFMLVKALAASSIPIRWLKYSYCALLIGVFDLWSTK